MINTKNYKNSNDFFSNEKLKLLIIFFQQGVVRVNPLNTIFKLLLFFFKTRIQKENITKYFLTQWGSKA